LPVLTGTSANDVHFKGLVRWNQDRERAAIGTTSSTYCSRLTCAANNLSEEVFGTWIDENFREPREYTGSLKLTCIAIECLHCFQITFLFLGELIGVEYLYSQTGRALEDLSSYREITDDEEGNADNDDIDDGFQVCSLNVMSSCVKTILLSKMFCF